MPVKIGKPANVTGLTDIVRNPIYATAVGLLQYGATHTEEQASAPPVDNVSGMVGKVKSWFLGNY